MTRAKKLRIIVLEDDRASRKLLAVTLEKAGYDVIQCSEGRDALHIATMHPPEFMIIDVMLPDMNGTEVAEELNHIPGCQNIKKFFLTGIISQKPNETKKQYRFKVGEKEYQAIPKPIKKSVLIKLLEDALLKEKQELEEAEERKKAAIAEAKEKLEEAIREQAKEMATEDEPDNFIDPIEEIDDIETSPIW